MGIASASRNTRTVLDRLNLWPLADAVSDGTSVERTKPAPDLFLHCARQLGVAPEEAVVVEDAAAGVEAALAGRFWTLGLGPQARVGNAHAVFPSLEGVSLAEALSRLPVALGGPAPTDPLARRGAGIPPRPPAPDGDGLYHRQRLPGHARRL